MVYPSEMDAEPLFERTMRIQRSIALAQYARSLVAGARIILNIDDPHWYIRRGNQMRGQIPREYVSIRSPQPPSLIFNAADAAMLERLPRLSKFPTYLEYAIPNSCAELTAVQEYSYRKGNKAARPNPPDEILTFTIFHTETGGGGSMAGRQGPSIGETFAIGETFDGVDDGALSERFDGPVSLTFCSARLFDVIMRDAMITPWGGVWLGFRHEIQHVVHMWSTDDLATREQTRYDEDRAFREQWYVE